MSDLAAASYERAQAPTRARRRRISIPVVLAGIVLLVGLVCAVFGPWIAPHDPNEQDLFASLAGPSRNHLLGTDELGRDILSRTIIGARTAILGPALIAFGAMLIGNFFGVLAGYRGGTSDTVISRLVDFVYALPALLIAIVVVGVLGGGYWLAVGLLLVLFSPVDTRIVRAATLEQRNRPYVEAARLLGLSDRRIMARHVWPNVLPIALANAFLTFAFAIVSLASLSFLGLGVGPGTADWGRMLSDSRNLLLDVPEAALAPGIAIVLVAVSVNILGDFLSENLADRGRAR
ncbi:MAG TPA: ABC transporter permease [Gaiellaceae bacterium]|nr:ABC transporter permease [Gaiellaceae bacterium]